MARGRIKFTRMVYLYALSEMDRRFDAAANFIMRLSNAKNSKGLPMMHQKLFDRVGARALHFAHTRELIRKRGIREGKFRQRKGRS